MKPLIIGLGNELLSDDGIGILAAKRFAFELDGKVEVIHSSISGLALIDLLIDYEKVVIIDSICTGKNKPGTVIELEPGDFRTIANPSPHYTGLPEIIAIAGQLNLEFPSVIKIFAIEVVDPITIGGDLSKPVLEALVDLRNNIISLLRKWGIEI
jgi:hydrogenase maturation protease